MAFRISGDTKIQWLVLQVHYASVKHIPESGDTTSIGIEYQGLRWIHIAFAEYVSQGWGRYF